MNREYAAVAVVAAEPSAGRPGEPSPVSGNVANLDVARLVRQAANGAEHAWERLVDQYSRLLWSITREFNLPDSDAADVVQNTWLRLVEHINRLHHPERVGSWLAATARNECLRNLAVRKRIVLTLEGDVFEDLDEGGPAIDEALLLAEQAEVVRDAVSHLPAHWQNLMEMLMADPPVSYSEISDELGLPIGSIGPTRGRCLDRLRVLLEAS
ncbi:MAG TPA: sigma-70 family RNA polymerase sigma factor [Trebonia sp.]|jgi:RNA polymerase sigma factor (sigma-70 family)|nr:sigma-70 family RNA polymerase sigma factor [Trebonia sp.]